jgi:hypothetical protein
VILWIVTAAFVLSVGLLVGMIGCAAANHTHPKPEPVKCQVTEYKPEPSNLYGPQDCCISGITYTPVYGCQACGPAATLEWYDGSGKFHVDEDGTITIEPDDE